MEDGKRNTLSAASFSFPTSLPSLFLFPSPTSFFTQKITTHLLFYLAWSKLRHASSSTARGETGGAPNNAGNERTNAEGDDDRLTPSFLPLLRTYVHVHSLPSSPSRRRRPRIEASAALSFSLPSPPFLVAPLVVAVASPFPLPTPPLLVPLFKRLRKSLSTQKERKRERTRRR